MHPRRWRTLAALIATASAFAISFVLLARVIGRASPWLGLLLMFYFLGLAKVAQPIFVFRMPRSLRAIRPDEERLDRRLGVAAFGAMLRDTPLRHLNAAVYLPNVRADLAALRRRLESAEAAHFWAAVLFMPYIGFVWFGGRSTEALVFLSFQ